MMYSNQLSYDAISVILIDLTNEILCGREFQYANSQLKLKLLSCMIDKCLIMCGNTSKIRNERNTMKCVEDYMII